MDIPSQLISVFILFAFSSVGGLNFHYLESRTDRAMDWAPDPECPYPDPLEIVYSPVNGDCTKYIECFDGVKTEKMCPEGLWWHQEIERCDDPGDYCDSSTTTFSPSEVSTMSSVTNTTTLSTTVTTPSSTTSEATTIFTTSTTSATQTSTTENPQTTTEEHHRDPRCVDNNTEYWPHPQYCSRYIECYQGDSYEMSCPPGLYFSDSHKQCVNVEDSECCANISKCL